MANSHMTPKECATAEEFVDELISLGVLKGVPHGDSLSTNCPLFLVTKPRQPDQYWCITNMKKGSQNAGCVGDPVQMTSPHQVILPLLNEGGFSASLDLAKFFHMFLTIESE